MTGKFGVKFRLIRFASKVLVGFTVFFCMILMISFML